MAEADDDRDPAATASRADREAPAPDDAAFPEHPADPAEPAGPTGPIQPEPPAGTVAAASGGESTRRVPRLHVIRRRIGGATRKALVRWLMRDLDRALGTRAVIGYCVIAWDEHGHPAVFTELGAPGNPVPGYVLPGYVSTVLSWWLTDGMPDDYGRA
jgi:hypothetical protein